METPLLSHLTADDYQLIYEPSEDSFLLLDALESDLEYLHKLNPLICLEIGSGSGVVITALAQQFQHKSRALCMAVDINLAACQATKQSAVKNLVDVEVLNMDLASSLSDGTVDLLVFNPPYVPTETAEIYRPGISRSWAGGIRGREVLDRLLTDVARLLSENGVFYLVILKENNPNEIGNIMAEIGFSMNIVKERKIRGEHLLIAKFLKNPKECCKCASEL